MTPWGIALLTGLLPIFTVNLCYFLAAALGHVPACVPYLEGCSSISATGRQLPETLVFKAGMISGAILLMLYWKFSTEWLVLMQGRKTATMRIIRMLGVLAAIFLIVYVVALGYRGSEYQLQRRIGITLFFSLTLLSELLTIRIMGVLVKSGKTLLKKHYYRWNLYLCLLLVILGLASIPLPLYSAKPYQWENILEWNFAMLLLVYFILNGYIWKKTGFRVVCTLDSDRPHKN